MENRRTSQQNRALHLYFSLLAEALNDAGYDMKKTLDTLKKKDVDIPWTGITIKENFWKPIQQAYLKDNKTSRLKKDDIDRIYDIINRITGEKLGVTVEFPNMDLLIEKESMV